ncbi:hypothetical protein PoB_001777900 [Plakobranchus ocellatus]|uniref:Uncharacterized protein n=1 Tax=Plakobranchus ocellatus TaxID=259542 RepID=A0AAV3Z7G0_9GAST|nr:hypothetical protein PoB_001777900 [Plakobranchus ocellatus]
MFYSAVCSHGRVDQASESNTSQNPYNSIAVNTGKASKTFGAQGQRLSEDYPSIQGYAPNPGPGWVKGCHPSPNYSVHQAQEQQPKQHPHVRVTAHLTKESAMNVAHSAENPQYTGFDNSTIPRRCGSTGTLQQQEKSFNSELQSLNWELSVDMAVNPDFHWNNTSHDSSHSPNFSDVTASAIFASLNCGSPDEAEFLMERLSQSNASNCSLNDSRKSSYDSACESVSTVNNFETTHSEKVKNSPDKILNFFDKANSSDFFDSPSKPNFTSFDLPDTVFRNNTPPSLARLDSSMPRKSKSYVSSSAYCEFPSNQNPCYNQPHTTASQGSLGLSDLLPNQSSIANTQTHMAQTSKLVPHPLTTGHSAHSGPKSIAYVAPWPESRSKSSNMDTFQGYYEDKRLDNLRAAQDSACPQLQPKQGNCSWMIKKEENFLEDLSDVLCKPPSRDSGVAELNVSPHLEAEDGREEKPWISFTNNPRDIEPSSSTQQCIARESLSSNSDQAQCFGGASRFAPPFSISSNRSASAAADDLQFEKRVTSTTDFHLESTSSLHSQNSALWTDTGRFDKKTDQYSFGGNHCSEDGTSFYKILDPLWTPSSTTPMDVTSAVTYILQKRPVFDCFPRAKEVFDSSYKLIKESRLNSRLKKG